MPASRLAPDDIAITAKHNVLTVEGRKTEKAQPEFLYQGISSRPRQTARPPSGCRCGRLPCLVPGVPDAWTRCILHHCRAVKIRVCEAGRARIPARCLTPGRAAAS
jgi:hypothetical protein